MAKQDPKRNRKDLYQGLVQSGDYTGTYDQFESDYSDANNVSNVLYKGLKDSGDIQDTSVEDFTDYYFGDIVKKKIPDYNPLGQPLPSDPLSQHISQSSSQSSSKDAAPTAAKKYDPYTTFGGIPLAQQIQRSRKEKAAKSKQEQEQEKKKLTDFYDKTEEMLPILGDAEEATKKLYRNWAAENGSLDRITYLEQRAEAESASERERLQGDMQTMEDLQEAKRKAAVEGNLDLYSKLNEMASAGAESLRSRTQFTEKGRSDSDLQLWEEAVNFRATLLNNKVDDLLKNPETTEKLKQLEAYKTQLDKDPSNGKIVEAYNALLQDEEIAKINRIANQGNELLNIEKETAAKFPQQFSERVARANHQAEIDKQFETGEQGLLGGIKNQVGRSATNFIADIVKLPSIADFDNSYGWQDKLSDSVDKLVDHIDNEFLPTPSKYNAPLVYKDDNSNTVFRTDLILPKVAKLGGDMAALLFGASKLSALGKVVGASTKVSQGIGLFSSSYVQTFDDYKKAAEGAGMSPQDAATFAATSSAVTSALEMISPQKYLWSKEDIAKRVVNNIASGMGKKEATKVAFKTFVKETMGENAQELAQMIGDKAVEAGANKLLGNDYFQHNQDDLINEALETVALTSIVAGAPAAAVATSHFANRENNYKEAIKLVAENRDKFLPLLQSAFKAAKSTPDQVRAVMKDIASVNTPQGGPLYMIDDTPVAKDKIIERIKDKNLDGVYVANDPALEPLLQNPDLYEPTPDVKVKQEKEKTKDGKVKEESPEDYAKRVAQAKIKELVASGDVTWDGKRANALTERGKIQLGLVMDEFRRAAFSSKKPAKPAGNNVKYSEQPSSEGVKDTYQIEGDTLNLDEFAASQKDPEHKRIAKVLSKAKSTLSTTVPNLRIALYNGEAQAKDLLTKLGSEVDPTGTNGFYDRKSGVIGIDLSKADATTAFHEALHPIIDAVKANKPEVFKALAQEASEMELDLADGSKVKYGDYTGNKEEALVEFLANYADGVFDKFNNKPSLTKKVKDLINKILQALGLKASDLKLNLNKPQKLKDFADSLASAISQGQTVNVGREVERVGTPFQRTGAKKKLNRTAERIAFDKQTEFKNIQADIIQNPDQYSYTQQNLNKKKQELKNMTLDEVVTDQTTDKLLDALTQDNQYAVLSAIELLRRRNASGEDTRPIFKKLREIGTGVGQLLRQFGELKNHSAEGIVHMVLGNLESMNLTLTDQQAKDLTDMAKNHHKNLGEKEAKRVAFIESPGKQEEAALKDATRAVDKSFAELNEFIGKVTPLGVDSMLATILQGNLLTPKSIIVNVASNIAQQLPFRLAELVAGDIATYMVNRFKGVDMMNPLEVYYKSTLNGIQGFGSGSVKAVKDITAGKNAETTATLEVRRNLKPLQALHQLFTSAGRATLPVNAKGKVPKRVYVEKFFEGTTGWVAEGLFRLLYLGDKPFKDAARNAGLFRLFAESGGKTHADFVKFTSNLSVAQEKQIKEFSEEATFSNDRTLSKTADSFVNFVNKSIDIMADSAANESVRHSLKVVGKIIAKSNTPFVRVPANLLQYLIELAVPVIPLYASYQYARKGDPRKSAQLFVRATVGGSMYYLANMLYDAGVILASGEGDDENERQLKYEVGRPNGINIDALSRFYAGTHDPSNPFRSGDLVVDFQKLGILGMYLGFNAELNESIKKELGKTREEVGIMTQITEGFGAVSRTALEMSFLQGAYTGLNSLAKGDFTNYFAELTNTMSAILVPNIVSVATRSRADYILRADDKDALQKFMERQSTKIFPSLEDNIAGVYPIVGMFGELAEQNPERGTFGETNPVIYQFLDITNGKEINDDLAIEVFNLSKRTGTVPFSAPTPKVKIEDQRVTLTEQDYVYLQQIAGRLKRMDLVYEMSQPEWKDLTDDDKIMVMEDINDTANADARDYIANMIYDGIDAGSITLGDDGYSYKERTQFDFDLAKRVVSEP